MNKLDVNGQGGAERDADTLRPDTSALTAERAVSDHIQQMAAQIGVAPLPRAVDTSEDRPLPEHHVLAPTLLQLVAGAFRRSH